ncbi:hypothetical protein HCY66_06975 [Acinetobacter radioresistens]|uniref:hypothetical protein n=1 Tax=Acinetobacter radioresistens TaxID=40216 RepID=UPI002003081D|nr:hypothetical protein [Acinetobacter radioresistens]MCK4089825.1 hypothetical protein [Acinetobacter radioresistens]
MNIEEQRKAFDEWHYRQYLLENPEIDQNNAKYIYEYSHKSPLVSSLREVQFMVWLASVQRKGHVLIPVEPTDSFIDDLANVVCDNFDTTIVGSAKCARKAYKFIIGDKND